MKIKFQSTFVFHCQPNFLKILNNFKPVDLYRRKSLYTSCLEYENLSKFKNKIRISSNFCFSWLPQYFSKMINNFETVSFFNETRFIKVVQNIKTYLNAHTKIEFQPTFVLNDQFNFSKVINNYKTIAFFEKQCSMKIVYNIQIY